MKVEWFALRKTKLLVKRQDFQLFQAVLGEPLTHSCALASGDTYVGDNSRTIGTDGVCYQATGDSLCAVTHENKN